MPAVLRVSKGTPGFLLLTVKVSSFLKFPESGNNYLKFGEITESAKKLQNDLWGIEPQPA